MAPPSPFFVDFGDRSFLVNAYGFRDYLLAGENPKFHAQLFHGRRDVDFQILNVQVEDESDDALTRIESLDVWSTPIVACTVDTVLGLLQNNRRGLYAWPALAGAAFVFDEIHAYDNKLFGALLRFLEAFPGIPVLLMTASLANVRFEALQEVLRARESDLPVIPEQPLESECWPRYQRQGPVDRRDPLPEVLAELAHGGKVLWVCNTVNEVMEAAERAEAARANPLIYHSRFRYEDRVNRHKDVIAAFKTDGSALAICSQVAEMSLDLSASLLVTAVCPVPALIQRLGRLHRRAKQGDAPRPFVVIEPRGELPYEGEDLEVARSWLTTLGEGPLAQSDLATKWEAFDVGQQPDRQSVTWLDGGPATRVGELREGSPGITVALQQDACGLRQPGGCPARVALPMPPPPGKWKYAWRNWPVVRGLPIAPPEAIAYCERKGAQWQNA